MVRRGVDSADEDDEDDEDEDEKMDESRSGGGSGTSSSLVDSSSIAADRFDVRSVRAATMLVDEGYRDEDEAEAVDGEERDSADG